MERRTFLTLTALAGGGTLAGCRDFADNVDFELPEGVGADGGARRDTGAEEDMGMAEEDMGMAEEDMGMADEDMGMAEEDMGMAEPKCATPSTDSISGNHGHEATVPLEDIEAGEERTYNIQGSSGHPHTITITSAQFAMLDMLGTITVTSSEDNGHTHDVQISCAA